MHLLNENVWIPIKTCTKVCSQSPINNIPAMVQIIAWCRPGDKSLSEPMRVILPTHICIARPQGVKSIPTATCSLRIWLKWQEFWKQCHCVGHIILCIAYIHRILKYQRVVFCQSTVKINRGLMRAIYNSSAVILIIGCHTLGPKMLLHLIWRF